MQVIQKLRNVNVSSRLGIIYQFRANTPLNPHTLNTLQPDGSQTDLFPHKQHEYRRHGTQMEYMPDII